MTPAELVATIRDDPRAKRLWSRVEVVGDCWEWQGSRLPKGYGRIGVAGRLEYTHRLAYELAVGPIPPGLQVLHSCDRPACANPEHLRVGNNADNVADKIARGREGGSIAALNRAKTHCPRGHAYAGSNVRIDRQRRRHCRTCRAAHQARYRMRALAALAQRDLRPEDRAA